MTTPPPTEAEDAVTSLVNQIQALQIPSTEFSFSTAQTLVAATPEEFKEKEAKENAKSLTTRLQNLPPELFNKVYKHTFEAPSGVRKIDATTQHSHLLTVSSFSRQTYAESYYGNDSIFEIDMNRVFHWINSFPQDHGKLIKEVRLTGYVFYLSSIDIMAFSQAMGRLASFYIQLQFDTLQIANPRLRIPKLFTWQMSMTANGKCVRRWMSLLDFLTLSRAARDAHNDEGPEGFQKAMEAYVKENCSRED